MFQRFFKENSLWILLLLIVLAWMASLWIGTVQISINQLFDLNNPENESIKKILLQHRLPRSIAAIFTGIALPISGWVLQEFFRNPLAGPSILGITSSAGLGVAILIVLGGSLGLGHLVLDPSFLIFGALLGAFIATLILSLISNKMSSTVGLIIVGFMIAALAGSLIGVLEFFASSNQLKSYVLWSFGSLNGLTYQQLIYYATFIAIGTLLVLFNIANLSKMQLGEMYAKTMGVNVKSLRLQLILASSILTGVCTALVGPIAFIGLAVPHICRIYLKTGNFKKLFVHVVLLGVLLMLVFSIIAESFPEGSIPINIITALFGAPIVLSIVLKNRNQTL